MQASQIQITRNDVLAEAGRRKLKWLAEGVYPSNVLKPFHDQYYAILDRFIDGDVKKLIITMPPQHGKSEGSTRLTPAKILGNYPDKRIAVASYSATFASKFNIAVQRIIEDPIYKHMFPDTNLNTNSSKKSETWLKNSYEFEIVNKKGSLISVGRGGPLTGNMVDIMIMDDLYKDPEEGNSPVIRQKVIDWYTGVVEKRLHNDSQQLIVFTRWHEDDLIGYLEKNTNVVECFCMDEVDKCIEEGAWVKINFEAIKETDPCEFDNREYGLALWPERHSLEKMKEERSKDRHTFNCMNQGKPGGKEGLLYGDFKTYEKLPENVKRKGNYTDTADQGDDRLCSICYDVGMNNLIYVTDVIYTSEGMEETEITVPMMINRNRTRYSNIESNNGGRGFGRVVEKKVTANVRLFHQSKNKESRILTNHVTVTDNIIMPFDWRTRWPEFYDAVTTYKKMFQANKYDDAADTLTGIVEKEIFDKDHQPLKVKVYN